MLIWSNPSKSLFLQAACVSEALGSVVGFMTLHMYRTLVETLGPAGHYGIYATAGIAGIIFTVTTVTETNGVYIG